MRRLGSAVLILSLVGVGAAAQAIGQADAPAQQCSRQTAEQVAGPDSPFLQPGFDPIRQVLCGSLAGPGSETMAVTFGAQTCWPVQGWAVYRYHDGAWQRVLFRGVFLTRKLVVVDGGLREATPIFRSGDPRCIPSGGEHARIWHWDGTRFAAGAWRRVAPGARRTSASFYSPSRNIECDMSDGPGESHVFCESFAHPHSVTMGLRGSLKICHGGTRTTTHCLGDPGEHTPVLRYGRRITTTHFRCRSERAGVTCIAIRTGRGFRIDRTGVTPVG